MAMEEIHVTRMMGLAPKARKFSLLTNYDPDAEPGLRLLDPWYGTADGFYDTLAAVRGRHV